MFGWRGSKGSVRRKEIEIEVARDFNVNVRCSDLSGCWERVKNNVRFQVLTAASTMFRVVFWDIKPCKMSSLMMEAVRTSKTSVDKHFTRQYVPEDNSEHVKNKIKRAYTLCCGFK
jgi:hypothetical protein